LANFNYQARDANGIAHAGAISAPNRNAAVTQLRDRGWIVIALKNLGASESKPKREFRIGNWFPPRSLDVELSLQQLALMNRSGMTLLASIDSVIEQTQSTTLAAIWTQIGEDIKQGKTLNQAMASHKCFPEFVVRLVKVGEQTGNMESVLNRGAKTMKDRRAAKEAFASATIYPVLIVSLAAAVTVYMVVYLIPRLQTYLDSLGKDMPAMTQFLIDSSAWMRGNYTLLTLGFLAIVCSVLIAYASSEGRLLIDRFLLRVPLFGRLIKLSETSNFARSLSMMLKSGITLTEGLGAVEKIVGNRFLSRSVSDARDKIIRGGNLVDALDQKGAFTGMLSKMAAVGQQTGELGNVLDEVALLHESQFQSLVKRLNAILTPLMTIVIGGVVGYVYIAFFLALVAAGS
jgi:type IV pilus assembly protein PilC